MPAPLEGIIRDERLIGVAGDIADNMFKDSLSYTNSDPQAKQVNTITIDTATPSQTYSVLIDGVEVSVESGAVTLPATLATSLGDAIAAEPLVNGRFDVQVAGAVITLTARFEGQGFMIALGQSAADMTLVEVTANATAAPIPFGRAVVSAGVSGSNKLAKLIDSSVADTAAANAQIVGVTLRSKDQETSAIDSNDAQYNPNESMSVMADGRLFVNIEADLTDPTVGVYVRTAADGSLDQLGGFAPAAGTGLVLWEKARWIRPAGNGLAIIEVQL